jgi:outer membrane receptor protein involved in Fe transport
MRFLVGATRRLLYDVRSGGGRGTLDPTSGDELNYDMRYQFRLAEGQSVTFSHQRVSRNRTHRYHRPTQEDDNERTAARIAYRAENLLPFAREFEIILYGQDKTDRRTWKPGDPDPKVGYSRTRTVQTELRTVSVFELWGGHRLVMGLSYQFDRGQSPGDGQFTLRKAGWTVGPPGERKAGPDSDWHSAAIFGQDTWEPLPGLRVDASLRFDYSRFQTYPYSSRYYPPEYMAYPQAFSSLRGAQTWDDFRSTDLVLTGGLGVGAQLTDWLNLFGSFTAGFRNWPPKFGVTQHGMGIYVPSRSSENILAYNFEAGWKLRHSKFEGEAAAYATWWEGYLRWTPGRYMGSDWFDWNGNGTRDPDESVFERVDSGNAVLYGAEISATYRFEGDLETLFGAGKGFWDGLSLTAGFMWNWGRDLAHRADPLDRTYEPIRHTHPARGIFTLRWEEPEKGNLWFSLTADVVDRFDRVPETILGNDPGFLRDPQDPASGLLRPFGLPGYTLFHFHGGWKVSKNLTLRLGCRNLFNRKYRSAHSRVDGPGADVLLGVDVRF